MATRWVHVRVDERLHERMQQAAKGDRRSLSNWVVVACERMLDGDAEKVLEFLRKTAPMADCMDLAAAAPGMPRTPFPELWGHLQADGSGAGPTPSDEKEPGQ